MPDKKFILASFLLLLTGIACALLPRFSQLPAQTQNVEQTLISLNNSLTQAIQTYQAGLANPDTPVQSQNPTPSNTNLTGVSPEAIAGFNRIDPDAELQTGQVLEIPAIRWKDISPGPTCPAQFVIPDWELSSDEQPQTAITPTARTQPTQVIIVSTQSLQAFDEPTRTLLVFDQPTVTRNPAIQNPPPGISLPTWTPLPPPPPAPLPTSTSIPITPPSLPPCFPPPCLPPIPPFP